MNKVIKIAIISGSGLEKAKFFDNSKDIPIDTPFGKTPLIIKEGKIEGREVFILNRHGLNHRISPSCVNYKANIWALKNIGCTHILATTAVGSLREVIKPGDLVFPNQFIDFTKTRQHTFFDKKEVIHTPMADPFCSNIIIELSKSAQELKINHHVNKTVVTTEGPRFSTKSESLMFRILGADIINMSTYPESALAREQGIHYSNIGMVTDYDSWKENNEAVTWEKVKEVMENNSSKVTGIISKIILKLKPWKDRCTI